MTVVVTGAGSGIGRATVQALLEAGRSVVASVRTEDSRERLLDALEHRAGLDTRLADVGDPEQVAALFDRPVEGLVAAAGICEQASLDEPGAARVWADVLAVNLTGVFHTLHAATPVLTAGASVVVVSSNLGKNGRAHYGAYSASKHGVLGLMRSAALELAPRGIRVNAVCPGWVDTPMARRDLGASAARAGCSPDELRAHVEAQIALGRQVRPREVADLVAWLLGPAAAAITGQAYNISAGEFFN